MGGETGMRSVFAMVDDIEGKLLVTGEKSDILISKHEEHLTEHRIYEIEDVSSDYKQFCVLRISQATKKATNKNIQQELFPSPSGKIISL